MIPAFLGHVLVGHVLEHWTKAVNMFRLRGRNVYGLHWNLDADPLCLVRPIDHLVRSGLRLIPLRYGRTTPPTSSEFPSVIF